VAADQAWVLLSYRLPREPSTPRSQVWRNLRRLGVVQIADGLVALPADPRTREALEWVAEEVVDHGGEAMLWLGQPAEASGRDILQARMTDAVATEYQALIDEARATPLDDPVTLRRLVQRLRREMQRIEARDYFPTPQRDEARRTIDALAATRLQSTR
jgi:hypothetical protein